MNEIFCKALIEVQKALKTLPKDCKGYGYTYTSLDTILTTVKPILTANKLGFVQMLKTVDGRNGIETVLFHENGESISSWVALPSVSGKGLNEAQSLGSAITYMKRYSLSAILGISSDEDVDGADVKQNVQQQNPQRPQNMPNGVQRGSQMYQQR